MAWPQYRGRLVPWVSWGEWDNVREGLFAAEPEAQQRALGVVSEWRVRGFVPHAVESTAQLVEILLAQAYGGRSGRETQLALSASLVRFVNGVVEPGQKSVRAISVTRLAHLAQLPQWLVELRHGATHSSLPTLPGLQAAAPQALEWLRDSYWQRQRDFVVNSIGACASALEDASRFAAAAARLSRRSSPLSLTSDLVLSASAPHIVISAADKARRSRVRQDSKRRRDAKAPAPAPPAPDSGQVADPVSEEEAASRAAVAAGRAQDALSPHGAQDVLVPLLLSPAALYAQYGSLVPPEVLRSGDVSRRCGGNGAVPLPAGATPGAGCFLRGWLVPVASRSLPPTRQGFERLLGRWLPALLAWNSAGGPRADVPLLALCAAARAIGYEQRAAMEARGVDDAGARLFSHRLFFLAWWVRYLLSAHWHTLAAISRHTRAAVGDDTGRKRRAPGQKTGGGGSKGEGGSSGSSGAVALPVRADLDRPTDAASLAPCACGRATPFLPPPPLPHTWEPHLPHRRPTALPACAQTNASSPARSARCARVAPARGPRPCSPWWTRAGSRRRGQRRSRASHPPSLPPRPSPTHPPTFCVCTPCPRARLGRPRVPRFGSLRREPLPTAGGPRAPPLRAAPPRSRTAAAGPSTYTSCRGRGRGPAPRRTQHTPRRQQTVGTGLRTGVPMRETQRDPRGQLRTRRQRGRRMGRAQWTPPPRHRRRRRSRHRRGHTGVATSLGLAGAGRGARRWWTCCRSPPVGPPSLGRHALSGAAPPPPTYSLPGWLGTSEDPGAPGCTPDRSRRELATSPPSSAATAPSAASAPPTAPPTASPTASSGAGSAGAAGMQSKQMALSSSTSSSAIRSAHSSMTWSCGCAVEWVTAARGGGGVQNGVQRGRPRTRWVTTFSLGRRLASCMISLGVMWKSLKRCSQARSSATRRWMSLARVNLAGVLSTYSSTWCRSQRCSDRVDVTITFAALACFSECACRSSKSRTSKFDRNPSCRFRLHKPRAPSASAPPGPRGARRQFVNAHLHRRSAVAPLRNGAALKQRGFGTLLPTQHGRCAPPPPHHAVLQRAGALVPSAYFHATRWRRPRQRCA